MTRLGGRGKTRNKTVELLGYKNGTQTCNIFPASEPSILCLGEEALICEAESTQYNIQFFGFILEEDHRK